MVYFNCQGSGCILKKISFAPVANDFLYIQIGIRVRARMTIKAVLTILISYKAYEILNRSIFFQYFLHLRGSFPEPFPGKYLMRVIKKGVNLRLA